MSNLFMSPPLDAVQAELTIRLWRTGEFDTFEIARMVGAGEDTISRTLQASRDIIRQMREAK